MKGQVPKQIRDRRSAILHSLSDRKKRDFYKSQIGRVGWLVPEGKRTMQLKGFTENYVETVVQMDRVFTGNRIKVKLTEVDDNGKMIGKAI